MKTHKGLKITGFVIIGIGFVALVIFVVMALWNWLVPDLFNGPEITYWQSAGILLLSKIIFTGFHKHPKGHPRTFWKKKFEEKWKCVPVDKKHEMMGKMHDKWFKDEDKKEE